jgi:hypothetical protein
MQVRNITKDTTELQIMLNIIIFNETILEMDI